MTLSAEFVAGLREILGDRGVISDASDQAPYLSDARQWVESSCDIVARPSTTAEVAEIVRRCREANVPIVPRGGGTGLVGGTVADEGVVLSLDRMRAVQHVDPLNMTMTVEAGCILKDIQDAAAEAECYFPLSLGAEGSCQIGGNISTNAGGVGVLRYGNTRELVMGLEVVLPNGEIWDGMNALRKNNMGYDLKQLFIGAEGTLGVITRAVLKLFPRPRTRVTLLAATDGLERILPLFDLVRANLGDRVTAFELIPRLAMELCTRHIDGLVDPFTEPHPQYALIEIASPRADEDLRGEIEHVLGGALETGQNIGRGLRRKRRSGLGAPASPGEYSRSPDPRRREYQARRFGARFPDNGVHREGQRPAHADGARGSFLRLRPYWGRQHSLQSHPARGRGWGGIHGPRGGTSSNRPRFGGGNGREHQRRTRHRHLQEGRTRALPVASGARSHAPDQARHGPRQHYEPGKDIFGVERVARRKSAMPLILSLFCRFAAFGGYNPDR